MARELLLGRIVGLRRTVNIKVRQMLMAMSYERRGSTVESGRPMRHLPSMPDRSSICYTKAQTAMVPKPRRMKRLLMIHSQSFVRHKYGARIAWTRSTRNKYLHVIQ